MSLNSFNSRKTLKVGSKTYTYFSLKAAEKNGLKGISQLPFSLKVVLENLLRFEDGRTVTKESIEAAAKWLANKGKTEAEIAMLPGLGQKSFRLLQTALQDHELSFKRQEAA